MFCLLNEVVVAVLIKITSSWGPRLEEHMELSVASGGACLALQAEGRDPKPGWVSCAGRKWLDWNCRAMASSLGTWQCRHTAWEHCRDRRGLGGTPAPEPHCCHCAGSPAASAAVTACGCAFYLFISSAIKRSCPWLCPWQRSDLQAQNVH